MKDVESAAKSVLLRARLQAEQLLAAAQREADGMKEAAREEGRREGFAQGVAEGSGQGAEAGRREAFEQHREELAAALQAVTSAAVALDAGRRELESAGLREVVATRRRHRPACDQAAGADRRERARRQRRQRR